MEATVEAYFAMLRSEWAGESYSKADYRRKLLPLLHGRSEQSIEFKHANISAILIELGFPFISGYKPRSNYQRLLFDVVSERLATNPQIHQLASADVARPVSIPTVDDILNALTDPPRPVALRNRIAEPSATYSTAPAVNYLELEAKNRSLGLAGEEFVINFERARLIHLGAEYFASKIEHVAKERGDRAGFDVLSFETSGQPKFIEVKTTKYGAHAPFFVSRNEVEVSKIHSAQYSLYRVFDFRARPLLFRLQGALSSTCSLDPTNYIARVA